MNHYTLSSEAETSTLSWTSQTNLVSSIIWIIRAVSFAVDTHRIFVLKSSKWLTASMSLHNCLKNHVLRAPPMTKFTIWIVWAITFLSELWIIYDARAWLWLIKWMPLFFTSVFHTTNFEKLYTRTNGILWNYFSLLNNHILKTVSHFYRLSSWELEYITNIYF